jgi:hypothetical protein
MTYKISTFPTQTHSIRWRQRNVMGFADLWITPEHRDYLNGVTPRPNPDREETSDLFQEMFGLK